MRKTLAIAIVGAGLTAACDGTLDFEGPVQDDPAAVARAKWDTEVQPMLETACWSCHSAAGGGIGPGIFVAPDPYQSTKDYPGMVVPGDPAMSRLYAYGQSATHTGPELDLTQAALVAEWIDLEPPGDAPPPEDKETAQISPVPGTNTFDLSLLNDGLEGATITFTFERLTAGVYLSAITVNAGINGVHLMHPLFTYWTPQANVDPVDSFYGMDLTVNPGETKLLGGGTLVLVGVPVDATLSIHFEKLENGMEAMDPGDPGDPLGGGCTNVTGFTTQAQPQLDAQCYSCHGGGNATAKNAFDLSALRDLTQAGQEAACGQVRGKMNLADPASSLLFQRVEPGQVTAHPLTLDATTYQQFRDPIVQWAQTEM